MEQSGLVCKWALVWLWLSFSPASARSGEQDLQAKLNDIKSEFRSVRLDTIRSLRAYPSLADKVAQPLVERFQRDTEIEVRVEAARTLAAINPEHPLFLSAMVAALDDDQGVIMGMAFQFLPDAGRPAVPALIRGLQDDKASQRAHAALCLSYLGPNAREAVLPLGKALSDADEAVRCNSALALWKMDVNAEPALPMLVKALIETKEGRGNVAGALAVIGGKSIPFLLKTLQHPDKNVRLWTANAFRKMGSVRQSAAPALRAALNDEDAEVRREVEWALEEMSESPGAR